jgi:hypothetical protein
MMKSGISDNSAMIAHASLRRGATVTTEVKRKGDGIGWAGKLPKLYIPPIEKNSSRGKVLGRRSSLCRWAQKHDDEESAFPSPNLRFRLPLVQHPMLAFLSVRGSRAGQNYPLQPEVDRRSRAGLGGVHFRCILPVGPPILVPPPRGSRGHPGHAIVSKH